MMSEKARTMCSTVKRSDEGSMQSSCFNFLINKMFCDCTLRTDDGKEIYGHRIILASASLYFRKALTNCPPNPVVRVPNISYLNLCLIVKFAYKGEVTMAENRLGGFLQDARTLGMLKAPADFKVTQKPRNETKRKQKRVRSKVDRTTANKRAAEEELQANECKKRKQEASEGEWSDISNAQPVEPHDNRKRRSSAERAPNESWDSQPVKRSRMVTIACQYCCQTFSDMKSLEHHEAFCDYAPDTENDSDDFDGEGWY